MAWRLHVLVLAVVAALATTPAHGAPPGLRTTGIARKADMLVVSIGLQDLFQPRDMDRLLSGFSTRVLIRVAVFRSDSATPVVQAMQLSEIVYDLWDEKLRVRLSTDKPAKPQVLQVATSKAAVDAATSLTDFPVVEVAKLQTRVTYHLNVRADLNPISEELVSNVRRWLSRPSGRGKAGSGDSFFGSFVSVFVNPRMDDSERVVQIVSQPFQIPATELP
jgi:hypothetical protein